MNKPSDDIDLVIKSKYFKTFDSQLLQLASEFGYSVENGNIISLKNGPQTRVFFKRLKIKIGEKEYQIDLRELPFDLKKDAMCRDFTINSIYLDIEKGCLIDYLGGVIDLQKKLLRGCNSPSIVFADKARVLRAFRFEQQLGFTIDDSLIQECQNTSLIDTDRKHGVTGEFCKILENKEKKYVILNRLVEFGVMPMILESFIPKKVKLTTILFQRDCERLIQWMIATEKDLHLIKCPIYGFSIEITSILKLMIAFLMLSSMPRQGDWSVQAFESDATTLVKKLFPNSVQEVWLVKTLLLMLVCTKEDNRISALAFNEHIIGQLPLTLVLAMQTCVHLGEKASNVVKSAAVAYKVHLAISN